MVEIYTTPEYLVTELAPVLTNFANICFSRVLYQNSKEYRYNKNIKLVVESSYYKLTTTCVIHFEFIKSKETVDCIISVSVRDDLVESLVLANTSHKFKAYVLNSNISTIINNLLFNIKNIHLYNYENNKNQ